MDKSQLEDDDQLDLEVQPINFWVERQKELVTNVVDYNLSTLTDLINDTTINLDPTHQRRLRWEPSRQSKLIESLLMNVPIPPIFLNEDEYGQYSVIDGKQRLSSIAAFLNNNLVLTNLEVFSDINGSKISDLPSKLRNILRTRPTIRAVIILRQSDPDIKYEVFQRLNTGGQKLNAQEIRNNAFHGSLNNMIMSVSDSKDFHSALGIKNKYKSAIYQEMRDAELVLRYLTFRDTWDEFSGGMKRPMDMFMDNNRNPDDITLELFEYEFKDTVSKVVSVFGEHAFQRWLPEKGEWRRQVLAALYDAEMFAFREYSRDSLYENRNEITEQFKLLFSNVDFRRSIDAATNTPSLFKARIRSVKDLLNGIIS